MAEEKTDWSLRPVDDLCGTELEWSTIGSERRFKSRVKKDCLFCGHRYIGGPHAIREHMDANLKPRHVSTPLASARMQS